MNGKSATGEDCTALRAQLDEAKQAVEKALIEKSRLEDLLRVAARLLDAAEEANTPGYPGAHNAWIRERDGFFEQISFSRDIISG